MERRIAIISEHASPLATLGGVDSGGQNVYVGELARKLVELGYRVDVFTRRDNSRLPEVVHWFPALRIIHVQAGPPSFVEKEAMLPFMEEFTRSMMEFIEREHVCYELVHANFFMSAMVASDLKERLGIPYVVTFHALGYIRHLHQQEMDRFPPERITIERKIVKQADRVIAECPQDQEDLVKYYQAAPEKITTVPCGFNPYEFYPIDRQLARMIVNIDPDEKVLLQLGRMVPRKGVDNVIAALSYLKKSGIVARLVVVGGAYDTPDPDREPEIGRLMDYARALGVSDQVTFAGKQKRDMLKFYYAASDVFITTPWYEPFGITPIEAMACAVPVIGSAVGGIQYTVVHGKTGLLVPPRDPASLASDVAHLLTNPRLAERMGKKGLKRVTSLFTWKRIALQMSSVYDQVLSPYYSRVESRREKLSLIETSFEKTVQTFMISKQRLAIPIFNAASMISDGLSTHRNVLILGDGRSAAQSNLLARRLAGRIKESKDEGASSREDDRNLNIPRILHYEEGFAEHIIHTGRKGDVVLCLCSETNQEDILDALKQARKKKMGCVAILAEGQTAIESYAHILLSIPACLERQMLELNTHILNTLYELIELALFPEAETSLSGQVRPYPAGDSLDASVAV